MSRSPSSRCDSTLPKYQLQKANNFAEIAIPGLESPPMQFIRGAAESLSVEFLVDTSDTLEDVRLKLIRGWGAAAVKG